MTLNRHGARNPGPSWITAALFFAMSFMTMISPVVGVLSNISSVPVPTVLNNVPAIPLVSFGTADAAVTAVIHNDNGEDIFIDPNCDPKLVLRQLGDDDGKPDCPCCYSRDGINLLPYQTPDLATRTGVAAPSWTAEHSLWQATATIHGEPVPTDDSNPIEFELCANCPDGLCAFMTPDRRRQVEGGENVAEGEENRVTATVPSTSTTSENPSPTSTSSSALEGEEKKEEEEKKKDEADENVGDSSYLTLEDALAEGLDVFYSDSSVNHAIIPQSLTHPAVWPYGELSWWRHMYGLATNRGARFGPKALPGKTDPRLDMANKYTSHAAMIRFDKKDDKGNRVRVDKGLAGGIIPIYGCAGIVIATDRGVYTAHIWEVPTFASSRWAEEPSDEVMDLYWDVGVTNLFANGNRNILSRSSPALADLVKAGGPLTEYTWIEVHLFGVKDFIYPDRFMYEVEYEMIEEELEKYLGKVPDRNFYRHYYHRNSPVSADGRLLNSREFYRYNAGDQLVAWQYAPKDVVVPGGTELQTMRAFRLWFNKKVISTRRWCGEGSKDCEEVCEKERPEADPKRVTLFGGMGKLESPAEGSESKPTEPESADKPKEPETEVKPTEPEAEAKPAEPPTEAEPTVPPTEAEPTVSPTEAEPEASGGSQIRDVGFAAPRSLVPRVPRSNPRLPAEFHEMFPEKLLDPQTWPYGALDWWKRMYTVAVKYGATGETGELMNIVSGDDYQPNHCVYRELPNLGPRGTGGGVTPLYGCSGLVVASNKGVYMGHFWERPNFREPPHGAIQQKPELYGNQRALWDRRVTDMLRNGWKPYFEHSPWGQSLEELAPTVFNAPDVDWIKIWILHPDFSRLELTGQPLYRENIGWLTTELKRILTINDENIELVTYMKYNTEAVAFVGSDKYYANNPGIHMFVWQFAPDANARHPRPDFKFVNAVRVFWDRRELWYYEWCPPGKDCSAPAQVYCAQRVTAGPSKREALAVRQDPASTQPADSPEPSALPSKDFFNSSRLTSPHEFGADSERWWQRMHDYATLFGADMHDLSASPDEFVTDHANFLEFKGLPEATGIAPMWGCTGIVVMSDKGVYTARLWEVPTFVVPYDAENPPKFLYEDEQVWNGRVVGLLTNGTASGNSDADTPSLSRLANGTNAFSPSAREWISVQIITPATHGNTTEDRPLYFKKVAKLRDLLVSILGIEKDEVKVKTYSARKDTKTLALNGTGDHFAETEQRYEDRPGANLLGIQYHPAQTLRRGTANETTVRVVRMWWDREDYFTQFWCSPKDFADFPENSTVTSDIQCTRPERESEKENKEQVCSFNLMAGLYPYDHMRTDLYVGFSRWDVEEDGKLGAFNHKSSHNASTTMGSQLLISGDESGLPHDLSVQFGQSWDEWLWSTGYTCRCDDEEGCDLYSPSCCADDSCVDYACNCAEPDEGGELCWPDKAHVAGCCLEKNGCLDDDMRREVDGVLAPNMHWEHFDHFFTYGNGTWSTELTEDIEDMELPPAKPFCASKSGRAGYKNPDAFGKKELLWETSYQCYFACGDWVTPPKDMIGQWEGRNVTMQFLPSVPLADDEPELYEDLEEPMYNPGENMTEGGTWTTQTGPVPMGLLNV